MKRSCKNHCVQVLHISLNNVSLSKAKNIFAKKKKGKMSYNLCFVEVGSTCEQLRNELQNIFTKILAICQKNSQRNLFVQNNFVKPLNHVCCLWYTFFKECLVLGSGYSLLGLLQTTIIFSRTVFKVVIEDYFCFVLFVFLTGYGGNTNINFVLKPKVPVTCQLIIERTSERCHE